VLDENVQDHVFERNADQEIEQMAVEKQKKALEDQKAEALQPDLNKFTLCQK
jgi:hypothetical protein